MSSVDVEVKRLIRSGADAIPGGANRLNLCQICGVFSPKNAVFTGKGEDVLCPMCLKRNEGLAYLMCRGCGKFLGFYKPGKVKLESGVIVLVEPGDTLHTVWCHSCNPKAKSFDIDEFKTLVLQANGNLPKEDKP